MAVNRQESDRKYYLKNKEKILAKHREYRELNPERIRESNRKWKEANPALCNNYKASYRAKKLQATPQWADKEKIKMWYLCAKIFKEEVDHIVPLQGKAVCGLHHEDNMQLLTTRENQSKSNLFRD